MKKWNKFYGSIGNTMLLLVLIALMIIVIIYMKQNPEVYFPEN